MVCWDHRLFKANRLVLPTVFWPQSRKKRMYLRTFFVNGLLASRVLPDRSPTLQSMHKDGFVAQYCLPLNYPPCFTERSVRKYNKHPKKSCAQTTAGVLSTLLLIHYSWTLSFSAIEKSSSIVLHLSHVPQSFTGSA